MRERRKSGIAKTALILVCLLKHIGSFTFLGGSWQARNEVFVGCVFDCFPTYIYEVISKALSGTGADGGW